MANSPTNCDCCDKPLTEDYTLFGWPGHNKVRLCKECLMTARLIPRCNDEHKN
jgi:hypothetical protein